MTTPLLEPIAWLPRGAIRLLDQTRLPTDEHYLELETVSGMAEAITALRVRGAPLIGVAAAMGVLLALHDGEGETLARVEAAADLLQATRPTAVNLAWALDRMRARAAAASPASLHSDLLAEAQAILAEEQAACQRIGEAGLALLGPAPVVLTHCNAGQLATGGLGTALAPIYLAHAEGRPIRALVPEARPLLQGSRLTAWELARAGVPATLMTDSMVASRLARGDVTCVLVGADRIAANGDVANKIGTYGLALAARAHRIPFYVAAPSSTVDLACATGAAIPIEERRPDEVTHLAGIATAPAGTVAWNPAFDVTPAEYVAAIITERGVIAPSALAESLARR